MESLDNYPYGLMTSAGQKLVGVFCKYNSCRLRIRWEFFYLEVFKPQNDFISCFNLAGIVMEDLSLFPAALRMWKTVIPACEAFVIACRTGKGGFARIDGATAFLDSTWHAIASLSLLGTI